MSTKINSRIDDDSYAALVAEAAKMERSVSWLVAALIRKFLKTQKAKR